ncbi:hypothetical protein J1614_006583 [Plenodomus biglobosus]|nr:hypothetical protein J1614_006583 [Plenodomus biglobosus]
MIFKTKPFRKLKFATSEAILTLTEPDLGLAMDLFDFAVRTAYEKVEKGRNEEFPVKSHDVENFDDDVVAEQVVEKRVVDERGETASDIDEKCANVFHDSASSSDTMVAMSRGNSEYSMQSGSSLSSKHVSTSAATHASYIPSKFNNTEYMNLEKRANPQTPPPATSRFQRPSSYQEKHQRKDRNSPTLVPGTLAIPSSNSQIIYQDHRFRIEASEDFLDLLELPDNPRRCRKINISPASSGNKIPHQDPSIAALSIPTPNRSNFTVSPLTAKLVRNLPSDTRRLAPPTIPSSPIKNPSLSACNYCPETLAVLERLADTIDRSCEARTKVAAAMDRSAEVQENVYNGGRLNSGGML